MPKERLTTTDSEPTPVKRKRLVNPLGFIAMKVFESRMGKMMSEVRETRDEEIVTHDPTGIELIQNDGSKTYVVHSTWPENLSNIQANGLTFSGIHRGKDRRPDVPDLRSTTVMMAGPKELAGQNRNIHTLGIPLWRLGRQRQYQVGVRI